MDNDAGVSRDEEHADTSPYLELIDPEESKLFS